MKAALSEKNVKYQYIDVCEDTLSLKKFIIVRDTSPAFEKARKEHMIGLPSMLINDDAFIVNADNIMDIINKHILL